MSVSTPIGALRRDEEQDPNTRDMVEGIVRELDPQGLPGGNGDYYNENFNDHMEYGAGHSEYDMQQFPPGPPNQFPPGQFPPGPPNQSPPTHFPPGPPNHSSYSNHSNQTDMSVKGKLMDYVMNNLKEPMLAAALYVVMSNDMVSELISRYIPYAGAPISGLVIRAILIAGAFIILKMLLVKNK